ncbi:acyl-CoA dehydrogenase family protein [Gluconobacter sp. NFX36]|uniref:acyl-CoA dehydrogenase family protein n=1 Tax=Gluconobacter sp. NFX36 TaxID=2819535 RepID=UPI003CFAF2AC
MSSSANFASAKERFQPIIETITRASREFEHDPALVRNIVQELKAAGLGRVRLPNELGGYGASLKQSFSLLKDLATADSNLPQIFRAHFAFIEGRLRHAHKSAEWFDRIREGALFGAAMAERSDETGVSTQLSSDGNESRLNGTKYYSTGTLYADWIIVWAAEGEQRAHVLVPSDAAGVTRLDDWDGFGQRLTGSGTTVFESVLIPPTQILDRSEPGNIPAHSYLAAYYQQFHLAALAGISAAVLRDAVDFVRPRTRTFGVPGKVVQREDSVVQGVVGRLSALAFSTSALVDRVSDALAEAEPAWLRGDTESVTFSEAEEAAFKAQQIVIDQTLEAANLLFEVGGASATSQTRNLDRHWRNARVLSSHNPAAQRRRELGDLALNNTPLWTPYREGLKKNLSKEPA